MKVLFVRPAKVAGSYIHKFLKEHIEFTDNKEYIFNEPNVSILKKHRKSFQFTVVRNPYLRAVSCWQFAMHAAVIDEIKQWWLPKTTSFEDFLDMDFDAISDPWFRCHIIPIAEYLTPKVIKRLDRVVRVENLYASLLDIMAYSDIKCHLPDVVWYDTGYDKSVLELLTKSDIRDKVYRKYEIDFNTFEYSRNFDLLF